MILRVYNLNMKFFLFTAYPDVVEEELTPDHEFVLLACDGIWDVLTNQEVVDFVRVRIANRMEPEVVCIFTFYITYLISPH